MYYIEQNNKITFIFNTAMEFENQKVIHPDWSELELKEVPEGYTIIDFKLMTMKEAEEKEEQKEQERIAKLSLTAADVERALYKAFGKDFDDIIAMVAELQPEGLDIKALKIELKANNFYRGNPYVNAVGTILGITPAQLDEFFETNDYTKLLSHS